MMWEDRFYVSGPNAASGFFLYLFDPLKNQGP